MEFKCSKLTSIDFDNDNIYFPIHHGKIAHWSLIRLKWTGEVWEVYYVDSLFAQDAGDIFCDAVTDMVKAYLTTYRKRMAEAAHARGRKRVKFSRDHGLNAKRASAAFVRVPMPSVKQKDLFTTAPELELGWNEQEIRFGEFRSQVGVDASHTEMGKLMALKTKSDKSIGDINMRLYEKLSGFTVMIRHDEDVLGTITAGNGGDFRYHDDMKMSDTDYILGGSFPLDYDFSGNRPQYLIGMSVPPIMTAQIALQIYEQWLSKIDSTNNKTIKDGNNTETRGEAAQPELGRSPEERRTEEEVRRGDHGGDNQGAEFEGGPGPQDGQGDTGDNEPTLNVKESHMEKENRKNLFEWISRIIETSNNDFHFEGVDNLIELFFEKTKDDDKRTELRLLRQRKWNDIHNILT